MSRAGAAYSDAEALRYSCCQLAWLRYGRVMQECNPIRHGHVAPARVVTAARTSAVGATAAQRLVPWSHAFQHVTPLRRADAEQPFHKASPHCGVGQQLRRGTVQASNKDRSFLPVKAGRDDMAAMENTWVHPLQARTRAVRDTITKPRRPCTRHSS